jgi:APA family basic amino acid/polyamine antiporter
MTPAAVTSPRSAPPRQLGVWVASAIVIANMIGTGVFTSAGFQAQRLHDPWTMVLTWVVGGVLALCGAATYAELASMMPHAGGEYVYLREAYHPAVGFMSGWVSLTAGFSAPIAASAIAFARYLATLAPSLGGPGAQVAVAIGLIVAVTGLHAFDTALGGRIQAAFTGVKVVLIALFIILGVTVGHGDWGHLAPAAGGLRNVGTSAFATSLMYVSFAYSGWNAGGYIAGEIARPERNVPRALLLGTGLVMALYVGINVVFLYAVPPSVLGGASGGGPIVEVGDAAARALFGAHAGSLLTSLIALALVSAVSAMIVAGPRVYAAMAEDKALPPALAWRNGRGVPVVAVLSQGLLGVLFVLVGDLGALIRFVGFSLALFAALTVGAVFLLRRRGLAAPYRTFGYPVTPVLFIGVSAWIAYAQIMDHPLESLFVAGVLIAGAVVYAITRPRAAGRAALPGARVVERDDA